MSEKNKIKGNMMNKKFKQLEKRVKKLEEKIGSNIWVNFDEVSIGKELYRLNKRCDELDKDVNGWRDGLNDTDKAVIKKAFAAFLDKFLKM